MTTIALPPQQPQTKGAPDQQLSRLFPGSNEVSAVLLGSVVDDQRTSTLPTGPDRMLVVVVGRENDLRDRVCDALVDSGAVVEVIDPGPPELRTRHSGHRRSGHAEGSPVSHRDGLQS
ncbi:hypothetical protein BFL43_00825 [Williamsia sp. 1135]|nr:hypothetical protein BFL43_00825 [Williamsia sp. 1135]